MNIIIVGSGKVGSHIAEQLVREKHDITIIDLDDSTLQRLADSLDIMTIKGNGVSPDTLQEARADVADLVIAATSSDEVNMVCCLTAKHLGAKYTIARIRTPEYTESIVELKQNLKIDMVINPENATAVEISRLLRFPSALKIELFARGRVELVEIKIAPHSVLDGMPLWAIYKEFQVKVLICAVQRGDEVFIPSGDFVLQAGDKINLTAPHMEITKFFRTIGIFRTGVKSVMILGGGRLAYYLAKDLLAMHVRVKIIEMDYERCEYLCEMLPEAVIIHGDGTDKELLQEEGLEKTDALVCLTGMDEENIVVALYGKAKKISKVIAKINRISFDEILDNLDIDGFISPKTIAANNIVRYVRSMQNSAGSSNVETLHRLVNERVEALEFKVNEKSPVVGIPLKNMKTKSGVLVATIIRGSRIIIPGGNDTIEIGDSVIIVTMTKLMDLKDILVKH